MAASHQRGHSVTKVKLFHITPYSYTQSWVKSPGESIDNISADRIDPAEMRRLGDPNRCDQASGPEKLTFKVAANGVSDASVASAMAVEDTPESAQLLKDYKAIKAPGKQAKQLAFRVMWAEGEYKTHLDRGIVTGSASLVNQELSLATSALSEKCFDLSQYVCLLGQVFCCEPGCLKQPRDDF